MADDAQPLLNGEILSHLYNLEVSARVVCEGLQSGTHRSPYRGHSIDFADHRPYVAGDDLRHLDWKILGRSDRFVLKRYEAEMDLACTLVVDASASMAYQGSASAVDKYRYASVLAASLAYIVLEQQDRVGLQIFNDDEVAFQLPARQGQFQRLCRALEAHQPASGTDCIKPLEKLAAPAYHKGLIIIISDCLGEVDDWARSLDRLRHRGHDVAMLWTLDHDERDFPIDQVCRFEGLESEESLTIEPRSLREAYLAEVEAHRQALQECCRARQVALVECHTSEAPQQPLNHLLVELQRRLLRK